MQHNVQDHPYWAQASTFIVRENSERIGYIYGIVENEKVIYIGKTSNFETRMRNHTHIQGRDVEVLCIEDPYDKMDALEADYILTFLPELNKTLPREGDYSTLDHYQKTDVRFYSSRVPVLRLLREIDAENVLGYFKKEDLEEVSRRLDEGGVS